MSCGGMARKGRRGTGEQFLGEELWMKSMEHIKKSCLERHCVAKVLQLGRSTQDVPTRAGLWKETVMGKKAQDICSVKKKKSQYFKNNEETPPGEHTV